MKGKTFHSVARAPKRRSVHDLSYQKVFTCDFGQLIPIYIEPMMPGDVFRMTADTIIRFQPLVAPVMHEINVSKHYFFVPYRIIWEKWEEFITGGPEGDNEDTPPTLTPTESANWLPNSLLEYIYDCIPSSTVPANRDNLPVKFPIMAYNKIYNDYYRDENLIDEVDIETSFAIQNRAWTKDYFTSALPFQQRGISPSIPIHMENMLIDDLPVTGTVNLPVQTIGPGVPNYTSVFGRHDTSVFGDSYAKLSLGPNAGFPGTTGSWPLEVRTLGQAELDYIASKLKVTGDVIADWDLNDFRTAWQTQRFLEAMARVGTRYTEYLRGIWNQSNGDNTLQRPEYIGGIKQPVIISEVLQTSETTTDDNPLGRMAGHGISANSTRVGNYKAKEWGICIGILSVMPKPSYAQGLDKRWLAKTRYDYPNPYFMHLSEQPISQSELIYSGLKSQDNVPFGFQGIWDEYRIKHDSVNGLIRTDLAHWSLFRQLQAPVTLSQSFIECNATLGGAFNPLKRIFAVPNEPGLIVTSATRNHAIRPIPFIAEPGLVDH